MPNETHQIEVVRNAIEVAFPAAIYTGQITPADGTLTPEMDEENELFHALKERKWTEVDKRVLDAQPDGYCLLTDAAFRSFLPAWLMYALENIEHESEVRDFVVYAFGTTAQKLRALNPEQRAALRSVLVYLGEHERRPSMAKRIDEGLENIALLERNLISFPWLDRSG